MNYIYIIKDLEINMKKLYFVLFNQSLTKVFSVNNDLPLYDTKVKINVGFNDPTEYNKWFYEKFNILVYRRYAIDSLHIKNVYFIVEPVKYNDNLNWTHISHLSKEVQKVIYKIAENYHKSFNVPWMNSGFRKFIDFGIESLYKKGVNEIIKIEQVKNAYVSTVFKYKTDIGDFYLKIVGGNFIKEIEILKNLLSKEYIPKVDVININEDKTAYLMSDMGGNNLENNFKFEHILDTTQLIAKLQKQVIHDFNKTNFYDLTLPTINKLIDEIPYSYKELLKESPYQLTHEEENDLLNSLEIYKKKLKLIQQINVVPNSIDHGDLRPGNIRVNTEKGQIIYDWAWSSYTHPFFTMIQFIHIIRNQISPINKEKIINTYLSYWLDYGSLYNLKEIYTKLVSIIRLHHYVIDKYWLEAIKKDYPENNIDPYSMDGWLYDRRQYYYYGVLKKLIKIKGE